MQKSRTKIGVFTKKDLKTPEGKKLFKALYRINHPKTGSKPAQDPEKLQIIGEMDLFPKPTTEGEARSLAAIEKESEKARKIHDALVRLVEMLKSKDKAHLAESVDGFLLRLKDGDGGEPLVFDALLLGAELGADTDTGNMFRQLINDQRRLADEQRETQRLLYRHGRKLDGVPPAMQKLQIATHSMAKATLQFMQQIKLDELHWEIYDRIEHKSQNQSEVARDLDMKSYQVSRAWGRIVEAFTVAGYPIAKKFTLRSAKMDEKDGMLVAKNRKKRKQFQTPRPSA